MTILLKVYKRIILTIPFVVVTIVYYYFNDPDDICHGLVDFVTNLLLYTLLILTLIISAIATFKHRQQHELKFEPISFSIISTTLLILAYSSFLRGHTKGDTFILATSKASKLTNEIQDLTLRKNGNFTVTFSSTDFSCSVSGTYKLSGDTIDFGKSIVDKTASKLTTKYLIKSKKVIPLMDTTDKIIFTIIETR